MTKIFTKAQERKIVSDYKKRLPIKNIAKEYNVSVTPIYKVLHKHNVVRSIKPLSNIQEKQIVKEYKNTSSVKDISKKYNKSSGVIYSILNKHNVKVKKLSKNKKKLLAMKDEIINLYTRECFTIRELAKQFNVNHAMMYTLLSEFKITFRSHAARFLTSKELELNICKDYLDCRDSKIVGKKYELSHVTILRIVRAYGIMTSDMFRKSCRRVS